jgi:hypothetical protein
MMMEMFFADDSFVLDGFSGDPGSSSCEVSALPLGLTNRPKLSSFAPKKDRKVIPADSE